MKNILRFQIDIILFYFIRMIVANEDQKLQDKILIPYKPIYGVPNKCTKTSDHQTTIEKYRICQINAIDKWKIELQHYVS